jgi:hypothetical protein
MRAKSSSVPSRPRYDVAVTLSDQPTLLRLFSHRRGIFFLASPENHTALAPAPNANGNALPYFILFQELVGYPSTSSV